MNLMIDTTGEHIGKQIEQELVSRGVNQNGFEWMDTTGMRISHCSRSAALAAPSEGVNPSNIKAFSWFS